MRFLIRKHKNDWKSSEKSNGIEILLAVKYQIEKAITKKNNQKYINKFVKNHFWRLQRLKHSFNSLNQSLTSKFFKSDYEKSIKIYWKRDVANFHNFFAMFVTLYFKNRVSPNFSRNYVNFLIYNLLNLQQKSKMKLVHHAMHNSFHKILLQEYGKISKVTKQFWFQIYLLHFDSFSFQFKNKDIVN